MKRTNTDVPSFGYTGAESHDCRMVNSVLARIGDKWSVLVVMFLADGSKRFNELKRLIGGVSQRMLTLTLRGLERDGLVTRTVTPSIPPRVDYELTDLGRSLQKHAVALAGWANENQSAIERARTRFDSERKQTS
ncbi:winged helix-turn-helix transcriptional regulator [Hansschlegelia plantiphila]|uniref:Transcriptional regulator n=1 Tax=Hansschlegelia plantiphila TaxID=374655 RepID=A0A9W6J3Q6_9HYPH|nr:helix-turn-helix domain-containing protein [Hansschlegelia plantiphila]GLK69772.1 transcriptional regulator [Hansschlegelia plantiphila]